MLMIMCERILLHTLFVVESAYSHSFCDLHLEHGDFLNTDISQGSVATHLRCGGVFSNRFYCKFAVESVSERIFKIGYDLPELLR